MQLNFILQIAERHGFIESRIECMVLLCERLFDFYGGQCNQAKACDRVDLDLGKIFYVSSRSLYL